jgi:NitT/TauT family transport system permease protein
VRAADTVLAADTVSTAGTTPTVGTEPTAGTTPTVGTEPTAGTAVTSKPAAAAAAARRPNPLLERLRSGPFLWGTVGIVATLVIWTAITSLKLVSPLIVPGPVDVIKAYKTMFTSPTIGQDLAASGQEFLIGYLLSVVVGVVLGLLMAWYKRLGWLLNPLVNIAYPTPRVALMPLLLIWFGTGTTSKLVLVFLTAVFPVLINTISGIQNLDASWLNAARAFHATNLQTFRTVALPGSMPFILAGMRLAIGYGLIGMFVGELLGADHGIGLLVSNAGATFQASLVLAGISVIALTGVILTALVGLVEKRFRARVFV